LKLATQACKMREAGQDNVAATSNQKLTNVIQYDS